MKKLLQSIIITLLLSVFYVSAQSNIYKINYELSMPNPASHLFEVKMDIETPAVENSIDLQMPRWSPGRYAVVDFAKGVQEVRAGSGCRNNLPVCVSVKLPISRIDTQTWRIIPNGNKNISISYKVFANNLSGTYSQLDERHANFNGSTIFMYVVDHKQDAVQLKIIPPPNWKIINGWMTNPNQTDWKFDNYDILVDTPTEIAPDWTVDEFRVDGKLYRVMVHSFGDEGGKRPQLVKDVEKIVRAQTAMMGAPEFESYTFLFHFAPKNETGGDGMEHLTSTQIILTDALANDGAYNGAIGTASHEFFHVWNVKRLRPVGLGPWDFTKPVNTRGLFIAEGFTNYYGDLMLYRAGIWNEKQTLENLARTVNFIENAPGSKLMSAVEASIVAPFLDRASRVQNTNLANTSVSYYPKGELVGFALDLMIRKRSNGKKSLDDVMRKMYEDFYLKSPKDSYYLRGKGFTIEDFQNVTTQVTGTDMSDFFTKYVFDVQMPPYNEGLEFVGLKLTGTDATRPNGEKITNYKIEEITNATAAQIANRKSWLSGKW